MHPRERMRVLSFLVEGQGCRAAWDSSSWQPSSLGCCWLCLPLCPQSLCMVAGGHRVSPSLGPSLGVQGLPRIGVQGREVLSGWGGETGTGGICCCFSPRVSLA